MSSCQIWRTNPSNIPVLFLALLIFTVGEGWVSSPSILTTICRVQGERTSSPYLGNLVTVQGVVFADLDQTYVRGFFIQAQACDASPSSSDGIFVYSGETINLVSSGDLVRVTGWVNEYYGMTEIRVTAEDVLVVSQSNLLPIAVELDPPFENESSVRYYESLEGMYVSLAEGSVVGPTDVYDRTWLVRADLGLRRIFWDTSPGTGGIICVDDAGLYEIDPEVKVGDRVEGLAGALDYRFDAYCLEPLIEPNVIERLSEPDGQDLLFQQNPFSRTMATFNLGNLFDTIDDPQTEDDILTAGQYARKLSKLAQVIHTGLGEPAFLAVQEAENEGVLSELVLSSEIDAVYRIILEEGPDRRGLDIGLLYRPDLALVNSHQVYQGCTTLIDGLGPDGNMDVYHPENTITCDSDGDGINDGNRLFSRPPLVVFGSLCYSDCLEDVSPLILIINHWKSKTEDSLLIQYTLPRRIQQAGFVSGLADQIRGSFYQVPLIVLGDMNDNPASEPLNQLLNQGMVDMISFLPKNEQYSYIHQGVSQLLDHVYFGPSAGILPTDVAILHINSDFPYSLANENGTYLRSSDHDAVIVNFSPISFWSYLPYINKK